MGVLAALSVLAVILVWGASAARAATTWTVSSTADDAGTAACNTSNSTCPTLRDAVNQSQAGDTVLVPAGNYTLTNGALQPLHALTIQGAGANLVTVDGNNASTVFDIGTGQTVTISGVTATHGFNTGNGGAIFDSGNLTLLNSTISNSVAQDSGGGIYLSGTVTMSGDTVTGNNAEQNGDSCGCGGGIYVGGTLNISNSTITGNTAGNSAPNSQSAGGYGGGIYDSDTLNTTNVTIASNTVVSFPQVFARSAIVPVPVTNGANVYVDDTSAGGFQNTIVAYPTGGNNCDTSGVFPPDNGNNLEDDPGQSCGFTAASDQNGDPKLGSLANNGGPTQTMALLSGSPAIDTAATINSITTDQRGGPRPQPPGGKYDIGAYEAGSVVDMGITKSASPNPVKVGQILTYTLKATNNGPSPDPAFAAIVTDKLPAVLALQSASASQGSCSDSAGTITCKLGTINKGASATVTIKVKTLKVGSVTNTGTVASSALDPNHANDHASVTTSVTGLKPKATTGAASAVSFTTATVHGSVTPNGASTTYYFEYGTSASYGSSTSHHGAGSGSSSRSKSAGLSGLRADTVYHYRIVAHNANGTAFGRDRTFKTKKRIAVVKPAFTG